MHASIDMMHRAVGSATCTRADQGICDGGLADEVLAHLETTPLTQHVKRVVDLDALARTVEVADSPISLSVRIAVCILVFASDVLIARLERCKEAAMPQEAAAKVDELVNLMNVQHLHPAVIDDVSHLRTQNQELMRVQQCKNRGSGGGSGSPCSCTG